MKPQRGDQTTTVGETHGTRDTGHGTRHTDHQSIRINVSFITNDAIYL